MEARPCYHSSVVTAPSSLCHSTIKPRLPHEPSDGLPLVKTAHAGSCCPPGPALTGSTPHMALHSWSCPPAVHGACGVGRRAQDQQPGPRREGRPQRLRRQHEAAAEGVHHDGARPRQPRHLGVADPVWRRDDHLHYHELVHMTRGRDCPVLEQVTYRLRSAAPGDQQHQDVLVLMNPRNAAQLLPAPRETLCHETRHCQHKLTKSPPRRPRRRWPAAPARWPASRHWTPQCRRARSAAHCPPAACHRSPAGAPRCLCWACTACGPPCSVHRCSVR